VFLFPVNRDFPDIHRDTGISSDSNMSNNTNARTLVPFRVGDVTDWSGALLNKEVYKYLGPGCIVRVTVNNPNTESWECLYFEITKVKDGTYWGTCQDTYRTDDAIGLPTGKTFSFRKEHIQEVPIDWQPSWFRKKVGGRTDMVQKEGYAVTGIR